MQLTELSLRRPVTVCMLFVCMTVIGLVAGNRLPLEALPDIQFPGLFITIPYPNSTPEDVERRIVRPAEEALAQLPNVKRMRSESREDGAGIFLFFGWGADMETRAVEARDKLDAIRDRLPAELERIQIFRGSTSDAPMLVLRISSDRNLKHSWDLLNRNLKRRIERLDGVARVELYGVQDKEVRVELSAERIAAHGIDLRQLGRTLREANFAITAGDFVQAGRRYYVKPQGRFADLDQVRDFVINPHGIRLRDVGEVKFVDPVRTDGRHLNRSYAIGLNVFRENGSNLVDVAGRVLEEVEQIRAVPEMQGINLYVMEDQADGVRSSLRDLLQAGMIGALLSMAVLFLFLRDWKMTAIVALSVPLSLVITLGFMYFSGFTLNILTLMGLMLSVGMLVDNSVVVTESIYRTREAIADPIEATLTGTRAVGLAVVAGTLTTAIVFLPNLFGAQSNITVFMSHVAVTICVSLAASLLVALTLIPQLTSRIRGTVAARTPWIDAITGVQQRLLGWVLRHHGKAMLLSVLTLCSYAIVNGIVGAAGGGPLVKMELFPEENSKRLLLRYNINDVYALEKVEAAVDRVEEYLYANQDRFEFESVYSYYSIGRAESTIILRDPSEGRTRTASQIKELIREGAPKIAIGQLSFDDNRNASGEKLTVRVFGESAEYLRSVADNVAAILRGVDGLTDVRVNAQAETQELRIRVNRDRARKHGLSSQEVAEFVAGAFRGTPLRPYRTDKGEVDFRIELRREDRLDLDSLRTLPILTPTGQRIALGAIAELSTGGVSGMIQRDNRQTSLQVEFSTEDGVTTEDAQKKISAVLDELSFPPGYGWGYGRAFDYEAEEMMNMLVNMVLALFCIYFVMGALFERALAPLAIIVSIGFGFVGAFWFFAATGTTMSFMGFIGMLVLMGIVVNNGIVLIDHVHRLRAAGLDRIEALMQGSRDRIRPILMTAATTMLGMVPLSLSSTAIGGNGPPYYPMARAIIGGLLFATVFTLVLLPTWYIAMEDWGHWGRRVLRRARGVPLDPAAEAAGRPSARPLPDPDTEAYP